MVDQSVKQIIIYGAFGILLGSKVVEVLLNGGAGWMDWWLLSIGIAAAIIHYLPTAKQGNDKKTTVEAARENPGEGGREFEALVLGDHPHAERSEPIADPLEPAVGSRSYRGR